MAAWGSKDWVGVMKMRGRRKKPAIRTRFTGVAHTDVPQCCTCGKPLVRLPASLSADKAQVFQCSDCFYPGTGHSGRDSSPVGAARATWYERIGQDN